MAKEVNLHVALETVHKLLDLEVEKFRAMKEGADLLAEVLQKASEDNEQGQTKQHSELGVQEGRSIPRATQG
jgi:hypothetical protein